MFEYVEVQKLDPEFEWMEIRAASESDSEALMVRVVIGDGHEMISSFAKRYAARREESAPPPPAQLGLIEEFFQEACMARVMAKTGTPSTDILELLPTTVIHFKYPERTSFRKSRPVRIKMFLDEAFNLLQRRQFDEAMRRLAWVLLLDPKNEEAYGLRVVCLRSSKKTAECIPVFEAWIEALPDQIEPRLGISEMWLYLDQFQRAKESFETILKMESKNCMALIGLAQAKTKLGEDPLTDLRKSWVLNPEFTTEMVERHFDFRRRHPEELTPRTLKDIADTYRIPMKRLRQRAINGVLPMHPPKEDGLLMFCKEDLDRYYEVLKNLGLEIAGRSHTGGTQSQAVQPGLFD